MKLLVGNLRYSAIAEEIVEWLGSVRPRSALDTFHDDNLIVSTHHPPAATLDYFEKFESRYI